MNTTDQQTTDTLLTALTAYKMWEECKRMQAGADQWALSSIVVVKGQYFYTHIVSSGHGMDNKRMGPYTLPELHAKLTELTGARP